MGDSGDKQTLVWRSDALIALASHMARSGDNLQQGTEQGLLHGEWFPPFLALSHSWDAPSGPGSFDTEEVRTRTRTRTRREPSMGTLGEPTSLASQGHGQVMGTTPFLTYRQ